MMDILVGIALLLAALLLLGAGGYVGYAYLNDKLRRKKDARNTKIACQKVKKTIAYRNRIDYFWKETKTVTRISLVLIILIILGIATETVYGVLSSILFTLIAGLFGLFAYKSFFDFETKTKERLDLFENRIRQAVEKEAGMIEAATMGMMDEQGNPVLKTEIFEFNASVKKIPFPPLEKDVKEQKIISTRRLEFLILGVNYFSVCKSATLYNLLQPAQEDADKLCAEKKGALGECSEFYYSQVQRIEYDTAKECVRIIFDFDHEDIEFACKKTAACRKAATGAFRERLRITERQRLRKQELEHNQHLFGDDATQDESNQD